MNWRNWRNWWKRSIPYAAPKLDFKDLEREARVVNVVDADTFDVIFRFRRHYDMHRCRLYGVNAPELHRGSESSKQVARQGKEFVERLLLEQIVELKCNGMDAFGRLLVSVTYQNENLAKKLILRGLAVSFV